MRSPSEIAGCIAQIAELMEIRGDNEFKIRAYKVAAEILSNYRSDTCALLSEIESPGIPRIGVNLASRIAELAKNASCHELDSLLGEIPLSVLDLKLVPGLGAKKVKALWSALGIGDLEQLENACQKNLLLDLKGFGEKQQNKILEGIELLKRYRGQMKQPRAFQLAELIRSKIIGEFPDAKLTLVGELARKTEVVRQIEFIVCNLKLSELEDAFKSVPEFVSIESTLHELNLLSRRSEKVMIRFVSDKNFLRNQILYTGCDEFAKWAEIKIDFLKEQPQEDERTLFEANNLPYVEPELREVIWQNNWENKQQPDLIDLSDLKAIIHCHSTYSDGVDPLRDMAEAAKSLGYQYLGIADHSISARYAGGLSIEKIEQQHREIDNINEQLAPFRVLKGIESDITLDGDLDYPPEILKKFDFIVASVHNGFQIGREAMTARVIKALRNPYTSILGHPTGRLLLEREEYEIDLEQVIDEAIRQGVVLEINSSPYRLDLDWRWAKLAKDRGAKFSIDPDSHRIASFSDLIYGVNVARKAGLSKKDVITCLGVEDFCGSLRK